MRTVALTMAAAVALTGVVTSNAMAEHPGSNGVLAVNGPGGFGIVSASGQGFELVPIAAYPYGVWAASFSADGTKLAYSTASGGKGFLRVRTAGGADSLVAELPGYVPSITWSPNGNQLALGVEHEFGGAYVYRVNADGTNLVQIRDLGDQARRPLIDWHPTQDKIALVWLTDVFTMNSAGHAVQQWTNECTYPVILAPFDGPWGPCQVVDRSYEDRVSWSPNGDAILVGMLRGCSLEPEDCPPDWDGWYLGRLDVGAQGAAPVIVWPPVAGADGEVYSDLDPGWSPDGASFVYRIHDQGDGSTEGIWRRPIGGGPATKIGRFSFFDWQPCPGGQCPVFSDGIPTTITSLVSTLWSCIRTCTTTGIEVSGSVTPAQSGRTVTVRLDALRNGSWRKVATKRPTLNAASTYRVSFGRPSGSRCRVVATYPGNDPYLMSTTTKIVPC